MTKIAIIGCGKMGQAIVGGLADEPDFEVVSVTTRRADKARKLAEQLGVPATTDNREAVEAADLVLLAVKPQLAHAVVQPLADALEGKLLVSICAGITTARLHDWAPKAAASSPIFAIRQTAIPRRYWRCEPISTLCICTTPSRSRTAASAKVSRTLAATTPTRRWSSERCWR